MKRSIAVLGALLLAGACATISPKAKVEKNFVDFGLSPERAACLAKELDARLDSGDLADVADYVGGLNKVETASEALDALLHIENPRAVAAIGAASLSCAFGGSS